MSDGITYHDGAGANPTLESMLASLTDGQLDELVIGMLAVMADARSRDALPPPDVLVDLRVALTSSRLTPSMARDVRVAIEPFTN